MGMGSAAVQGQAVQTLAKGSTAPSGIPGCLLNGRISDANVKD